MFQGVVIAGLVRLQVIHSLGTGATSPCRQWIHPSVDDYYSAERLSIGLQDFLISIEMMLVAAAHLHTFSYK